MRAINQWREFLMDSDLSSPAKLVGFCLAQYYRPNKPTYPSQTTLMQDSSYSKNTVKDAIRELVAKCLITVEEKRIVGNSFKSFSYKFIGSAGEPVNEPVNEPSNAPSFNPSIDGAGGEPKVLEVFKENKEESIVPKKVTPKVKNGYTEEFEEFWKAYCRPKDKGSKPEAFKEWQKLTETERPKAMQGIIPYKDSQNSPEYMKHAERYLKHKMWEGTVVESGLFEEYWDDATGKIKQRAIV